MAKRLVNQVGLQIKRCYRLSVNGVKHKSLLFFVIPILAILACNAPIEEIFPAGTPTVLRPTIGPPPTLTPISLDNSEFIIITNTPQPTATATPVVDTPVPELVVSPSATPTLFPTVTQDPDIDDEQATPTVDLTPRTQLDLDFSIVWENGNELTENFVYAGQITFAATGGSDAYIYFVEGIQLASNVFNMTINNCSTLVFPVVVQSADTTPFSEDIIVEGPCLGLEDIEGIADP